MNRHKLCIVVILFLSAGLVSSAICLVYIIWETRWNMQYMKEKDHKYVDLVHEYRKYTAEAQNYEREVKRFQKEQELLNQVLGFPSDTNAASVAITLEKESMNANNKLEKPLALDKLNVMDLIKIYSEKMSNR